MRTLLFSNEFGDFILAEYAKLLPLGTKSVENPQFGNHKHCSMKTLCIREKTLLFGIPITYVSGIHPGYCKEG
jgi:hypothetical protein